MIQWAQVADRFGLEFADSLTLEELEAEWAPLAEMRDRQEAHKVAESLAKILVSLLR
jgi:hypothetical protein